MSSRTFGVRPIITKLVLARIMRVPQDGWWGEIDLCTAWPEIGGPALSKDDDKRQVDLAQAARPSTRTGPGTWS